jgi:hypothetical protein
MIIEKLESVFGKMTVVRGSKHVFLSMDIEYNEDERTADISMKQ